MIEEKYLISSDLHVHIYIKTANEGKFPPTLAQPSNRLISRRNYIHRGNESATLNSSYSHHQIQHSFIINGKDGVKALFHSKLFTSSHREAWDVHFSFQDDHNLGWLSWRYQYCPILH